LVLRLEPELDDPDGSLMLLPRLDDDPEDPPDDIPLPEEPDDPEPDDPLPPLPWSLPLQPTNNAAAPAIANSFFIMVNLPPANRCFVAGQPQWVKCCIRDSMIPAKA
jgi:hypothetical protein